MPADINDLAQYIAALCRTLRSESIDSVETACTLASDILSEDEADAPADESVIDGLRWGHRAAQTVERDDGAIIRIITRGARVTHEYPEAAVTDGRLALAARRIETALQDEIGPHQSEREAGA